VSFVEREVVWMTEKQRDIKRKLAVLKSAEDCGNGAKTRRHFRISRQCYCNWLRAYERRGEAGLVGGGADSRGTLISSRHDRGRTMPATHRQSLAVVLTSATGLVSVILVGAIVISAMLLSASAVEAAVRSDQPPVSVTLARILRASHPGAIYLLHAASPSNTGALAAAIRASSARAMTSLLSTSCPSVDRPPTVPRHEGRETA